MPTTTSPSDMVGCERVMFNYTYKKFKFITLHKYLYRQADKREHARQGTELNKKIKGTEGGEVTHNPPKPEPKKKPRLYYFIWEGAIFHFITDSLRHF